MPRAKTVKPPPAPKTHRPGEFEFIESIRTRGPRHDRDAPGLVRGIGDDAAVFTASPESALLVTSDLLVEDVDFRRAFFSPEAIGHKAVAASLSDIAAMGGRPRWVLLSVGVPREVWDERDFVGRLHGAASRLAGLFGAHVIGGDISRTPERIVVDATVIGETLPESSFVARAGARPGDQIFVTGTLGGAAAALRLFEHARAMPADEARHYLSKFSSLISRQTTPAPRVEWGELLGTRDGESGHGCLATAMIDISDGLSSDLAHLCRESGVGALVEAARVPVNPDIKQARAAGDDACTRALKSDALALALHGGEDFELLFTVRPGDARRLPGEKLGGASVTRIGEITKQGEGIKLLRGGRKTNLRPSGFEHFRRAD
jgi:thiamine-monophosphate kinase